jgi:hypothetical protein
MPKGRPTPGRPIGRPGVGPPKGILLRPLNDRLISIHFASPWSWNSPITNNQERSLIDVNRWLHWQYVKKTCWKDMFARHVVKTCWQDMFARHVGKTCWQYMLATLVGNTCCKLMLARHVGQTCWPDMLARHVGQTCWPDMLATLVGNPCWQHMLAKNICGHLLYRSVVLQLALLDPSLGMVEWHWY